MYIICVQVNRGIDVDVVVAEVRETSRKPDEVWQYLYTVLCTMHRKSTDRLLCT